MAFNGMSCYGLTLIFLIVSTIVEFEALTLTLATLRYSSVPQGSCLGPSLFLIYINDLPEVANTSPVSMYADDKSLTFQSQDISQLNETINDDLKRLKLWMQGNKLQLNVSKTQSMLICTRPKHQKLRTAGDNICLTIREKDLDVVQKSEALRSTSRLTLVFVTYKKIQSFAAYTLYI